MKLQPVKLACLTIQDTGKSCSAIAAYKYKNIVEHISYKQNYNVFIHIRIHR